MQHHEREPRRSDAAERKPEPRAAEAPALPAEAAVLGLQHAAGNRAVSELLARQPKPGPSRGATSTLGLGDEIGVIPLDSAMLGQADRDGQIHDLTVSFVENPAVPALQQAMLSGKAIPEGFYSTTSMKLALSGIVIASMTYSENPEGDKMVSLSVNFTSAAFEPAH